MCCSVLCNEKGKKAGVCKWDIGPRGIECSKPQNPMFFPVANKYLQQFGVAIIAIYPQYFKYEV